MVREIPPLNEKYDSYFDLHGIEDIGDLFDVIQVHNSPDITGKLIWKGNHDLPTELIRDITQLFNRYFVD
ncbi:hypothetical protein [Mucilaginibacter lacusdianchii]|uniref:hypothetical protein n=1 Tax=Mucilaginibacter lacusdianchii TaxID=2684211 RepID=UPI00131D3F92|nr:hypothetical protein [Mucilaginibacter sp. JXJ CY 39]